MSFMPIGRRYRAGGFERVWRRKPGVWVEERSEEARLRA
jgi:hypothetical protein